MSAVSQPLFAHDFGSGARKVLALHCTMAHSGAWRGLSQALEAQTTFHCLDMYNHGRSPDWDGQGDFQDRMVKAAAAHLSEPMDVVGHSFGATVALRLAIDHPDLVRTLSIIEPVYFAVAAQDQPELVPLEKAKSAPFYAEVHAGNFETAARIFNRGWGGDSGRPWAELSEKTRAAMARGVQIVPACAPAIIDDLHAIMTPGVLEAVSMPTLLLRGGTSEKIIGVVNDGLARRMPNTLNEVVEGAGHMVPLTHVPETAAALGRLFEMG
ncbi:MAG: alpha/beta fold hydrolase [Sedimentitalea sp.]